MRDEGLGIVVSALVRVLWSLVWVASQGFKEWVTWFRVWGQGAHGFEILEPAASCRV